MPNKHKINDPAFIAIMLRELHNKADIIPDGFLTAKQWSEKWKFNKSNRVLKKGLKFGLLEMKEFKVPFNDGRVLRVPHYRFIGDKKTNLTKPLKKTK